MIITNIFIHAIFIILQIFMGVFIIKWGFDIGIIFPIAFVGLIFLFNATCGIVSSIRDN